MVSLTEFVKGPVLGAGAGDEKALALDLGKIPNAKKLMPLFQDEIVVRDGKPYFIPVYWGYDSVLYNTEAIAEDMAQSWGILFDDKYAGKVALRDDAHQMIYRRRAVPRSRGSQRDDGCRTQGRGRLPDLEEEELPYPLEQVRRGGEPDGERRGHRHVRMESRCARGCSARVIPSPTTGPARVFWSGTSRPSFPRTRRRPTAPTASSTPCCRGSSVTS